MRKALSVLLLSGILASCGMSQSKSTSEVNSINTATMSNQETKSAIPTEMAINAFNALFRDYSEEGVKEVFAEDIIQHNPFVPTGRDALLGFLPTLKKLGTTYQNHRLFQDGEYAIMNNTLNNADAFGAKQIVSFNVYRTENGKIVEHWGVPVPIVENPVEGVTQFSGATEVNDLDKTDENKAAATKLFNIVVNGTQEEVGEIVTATFEPDYVNHNPTVGNGTAALFEAFENQQWIYKKNHKLLGQGNFVLSISEGTASGNPVAFYDLLRFENGKVVEHWDVIFPIPTEGLANDNGMFGGF
jgi:predicted SnoaL-like aldol condensation-catalyzing enzyme